MDKDVLGPGMAPLQPPRRAGFALVEVLLAALLLAVGAAGVAGSLRQAWRGLGAAERAQEAVTRLADLAEELRSAPPTERPAAAAAWQARAGAGASVSLGPVLEGVASWQASLEWPDRDLSRPVQVVQPIGVAP